MSIVEPYAAAIIVRFITVICWGPWVNITRLVNDKKWEFLLFCWDYSIGLLLCSLLLTLTLGSTGEVGRSFIPDTQQASSSNLMSTVLARTIFDIPNIPLVVSISLAGMVVAFPMGVGLALALGAITTHTGSSRGDPLILFLGVAYVVTVIIFTMTAYGCVTQEADKSRRDKGLITAILTGIIMGQFSRFPAGFMSDNFSQPTSGLMTPCSAFILSAAGLFLLNLVLNTLVMKKLTSGESVNGEVYFPGNLRDHTCSWLGGMVWCVGPAFSLIAFDQVGHAISYGLGQGAIMIAMIWGIFIRKEFASVPVGINKLLLIMFISHIAGIVLVTAVNQ